MGTTSSRSTGHQQMGNQEDRLQANGSKESRGTCRHERAEPDLKTDESLFISLLVSWKSLATLSAGPNFVTLI